MKLTAVIFDWAGTLVDHGSCGPVAALCEVFSSAGVPISAEEARGPMGLSKRAHIEALLKLPRVADEWKQIHGHAPLPEDAAALYAAFVPKQLEILPRYSDLIDGVAEAAERLRARGFKIGTTTGYNRAMLEYLLDRARSQEFVPDSSVCPDDVPAGRPHPFMCYRNALQMAVAPLSTMVKIGDTPADIEEGRNAGMITIGITRTGNEAGFSRAEWDAAPKQERMQRLTRARQTLTAAGADYLAESVADCGDVLDRIERDRFR